MTGPFSISFLSVCHAQIQSVVRLERSGYHPTMLSFSMLPWAFEAGAKESNHLSPHSLSSTACPTDTVQGRCEREALEDSYHDLHNLCLGDASVLVLQDESRYGFPLSAVRSPYAPTFCCSLSDTAFVSYPFDRIWKGSNYLVLVCR